MIKLFALVLALAMLSQSLSALWVTAGFYANRDFIAKNQCESRFVLNSSCKGQCVLMKKLKEQQEKEQQQPDLKLKEIVLFSQVTESFGIGEYTGFERTVRYHPQPEPHYLFRMEHAIFHPPIS
ncbi:hypothetical protein [Parapedobacter indicus]|uniref:Uncharacterized protein n=1 Tax=Parapedobacter indicus TaxID=1477437 RepID=A0A1I3NN83_9SPHI|nr:hypothetical protein [Parapedobacter indicus]PPL01036.1 hypothetical protein CLV26_107257 [Parapedobacter indicus]SFJ10695.1 hypothetical protein SAMN05444682_107257 [Parapedobacter indicus]